MRVSFECVSDLNAKFWYDGGLTAMVDLSAGLVVVLVRRVV